MILLKGGGDKENDPLPERGKGDPHAWSEESEFAFILG
jgi:hypothetical protein